MLIVHIDTEDKSQKLVAVHWFLVQCEKGEPTENCHQTLELYAGLYSILGSFSTFF